MNRPLAALLASSCFAVALPASADPGTGGFAWDRKDRLAVVAAFARHYVPSEGYEARADWNGDVDTCSAGTLSDEVLDDTLRRINWYRAQAGAPADVARDPALDAKAQQAALIMAREGALSHDPSTDFPDNACLTDEGDAAAAKSNLALAAWGPGAIDYLMLDTGAGNTAVGHRRWTLYLRQKTMGNGAVPRTSDRYAAHAQYVFAGFGPAPSARAVAWPNEGFVPWQVLPGEGEEPARWSFSYPGAGFAAASVTVEKLGAGGGFLAVTKESVAAGFGDNTLVWKVDGVDDTRPGAGTTWRVTVSGVTGAPSSIFTYDVTSLDPFDPGVDLSPSGPSSPRKGSAAGYAFAGFDEAEGYDLRFASPVPATWTEGAEASPAPRVIDSTSASYALLESADASSGARSFHLTAPSYDEATQSFEIDRILVPTEDSVLRFANRRRCVSTTTRLEAQGSLDGHAWETLWSRSGKSGIACAQPADWDAAFQQVEVPLPDAWAGLTVRLRFVMTAGFPAFLGSGAGTGFLIDDVSVEDSVELLDPVLESLDAGATGFAWTPPDREEKWMQLRARIGDVAYAWSEPFVLTPANPCGDANDDGRVTAADALKALKTAVGSDSCTSGACDANGNGSVSAADALLILRLAVGTPLPTACPAA